MTDDGVLIAETAFYRHYNMTSVFNEIRYLSEQCIACYIERRNKQEVITSEVCIFSKHKIDAYIIPECSPVHLPYHFHISISILDRHIADPEIRCPAVQNGGSVLYFKID